MARTTITVITDVTDRDHAMTLLSGPFSALGLDLAGLEPESGGDGRWLADVDEETAMALLAELAESDASGLGTDLGGGHWAEIPLDVR